MSFWNSWFGRSKAASPSLANEPAKPSTLGLDKTRTQRTWTVIQDGHGKMFVRTYDINEDRFTSTPVPDIAAAEQHIRANSFKVVADYNRYGERIEGKHS